MSEAPAPEQYAHAARQLHAEKLALTLKVATLEAQNEELLKLNERLRGELDRAKSDGGRWRKRFDDAVGEAHDQRTGDEKAWDQFAAAVIASGRSPELEAAVQVADAMMALRARRNPKQPERCDRVLSPGHGESAARCVREAGHDGGCDFIAGRAP
jgi:hypothetical protein